MPKVTFGERSSFTLVTCFSNNMWNIVTTWVNIRMKTNTQCPLENFKILCLKIYSYLTKTLCQSLHLVKELFLFWSPICQKNLKYSDHLSERPCESKCSVPPGKFSNRHVKILFIFDKSLMPKGYFWWNSYFYTGHLFVNETGNIVPPRNF